MTVENSALQHHQEQVERAEAYIASAENELRDKKEMTVVQACVGAVIGCMVGLILRPGRFVVPVAIGSAVAADIISIRQEGMDRQRSELGRRQLPYSKAQHSLKVDQVVDTVDTEIDHITCALLKHHGWYYCNKEGQRLRNAAEVNQVIIEKRAAMQECQEQVEQARNDIRSAENMLWDNKEMMFVQAGISSVIGSWFVFEGRPIIAVLIASVAATCTKLYYQQGVHRARNALERYKKDYQSVQTSVKETKHDLEILQAELDKFTHLKRPKLVPVEWRYFYRHRHIVLTDVTMNRPEIDFKMNTRLHHYFSKFRSFCFP